MHARGFEPRTKENIGKFSTRTHLRKMYTNTTAQLVIKEVFKYIFAKMYTNTANPKDCGMDPPPHPPPRDMNGKDSKHLKCFPTSANFVVLSTVDTTGA